jgi:zinc transport system substrate-binding protein
VSTTRYVIAAAAAAGLVVSLLSGCATDSAATAPSGRPVIAAAFYPIEELVRSVGGESVDVFTLVPPGQEAHDYEPTAQQVGKLQSAQVVFYLGDGFQPDVEKAVASLPDSVRKVDLLESVNLLPVTDALQGTEGDIEGEVLTGGNDPHVWLDPQNMIAMAKVVAETLDTDATGFVDQLQRLDTSFSGGLVHCRSHVIVTSHRAFEYLSHRYGLTQIPIAGISPTEEPSAKTLEAVAKAARANNVTTIYFEAGVPDDLANTVADEIGATTAVLDPLESLSSDQLDAGATYISVMTEDLATLRAGLGCT